MKKMITTLLLTAIMVLGAAAVALAAETAVTVAGLQVYAAIATAAGFGIALAAIGTGIAQGLAIKGAVEGTARNPEASGKISTTMIIGLALIESLCIYALVIALILLFLFPNNPNLLKMVGIGG